ncbi:MAG: sodium/proline symporter [Parachlamydiales bacterium]|nr:sodium/proline symporter [Parachlamydiales bacterium]
MELSIFLAYFAFILLVTFFSYRKQKSDTQFVLGNRSLNFYLTALSAHASDMSNWLFMGYPALIFTTGLFNAWAAVGLVFFMFLNWQLIAPRLRRETEALQSLTLNTYFERRFKDSSGAIRIVSAIMTLVFFLFYISAGLVGTGYLAESLFGLPYWVGITCGLLFVVFYLFLGGYVTLAWIDLVQGLFILLVLLFIPFYLIPHCGGISSIFEAIKMRNLTTTLFPDFHRKTLMEIVLISCGWGLGYFGQPHILTKFMGIKKIEEMHKAKWVGISWQFITLATATMIGLIGIYLFPHSLENPELVILEIVKQTFFPLFSVIVLCAVLAASTNVMAAQILVVASSISEDLYPRFVAKKPSHKELLIVSKISVVGVGLCAFVIALFKISTIYQLVFYSWSGIGSSFGPLVLFSLYSQKITKHGAMAGILSGGCIAGIWPYMNRYLPWNIPSMMPAFLVSLFFIYIVSSISSNNLKKTKNLNKL